jgi:peroxiredoxin
MKVSQKTLILTALAATKVMVPATPASATPHCFDERATFVGNLQEV